MQGLGVKFCGFRVLCTIVRDLVSCSIAFTTMFASSAGMCWP